MDYEVQSGPTPLAAKLGISGPCYDIASKTVCLGIYCTPDDITCWLNHEVLHHILATTVDEYTSRRLDDLRFLAGKVDSSILRFLEECIGGFCLEPEIQNRAGVTQSFIRNRCNTEVD